MVAMAAILFGFCYINPPKKVLLFLDRKHVEYEKMYGKIMLVSMLIQLVSQSNVSKNINFIAKELNCTQELVSEKPVRFKNRSDIYEHSQTNVNDKIVCGNIKDLICIKESNHTKFSYEEITHMIEYLCTC